MDVGFEDVDEDPVALYLGYYDWGGWMPDDMVGLWASPY